MVALHGASETHTEFALNPLLRQFGRQRVVALGGEETLAERHATRMMVLAETAEPELIGANQRHWLERIDALFEDFRAAHEWFLQRARSVDALRLSGSLWRYAYVRGRCNVIRSWIESSLANVTGHDSLRSSALNGIGLLANVTGNPDRARLLHQHALGIATRDGNHREIAIARIGLADLDVDFGQEFERALRHLELAYHAYEEIGEARGLASVLTNQGNIQWQMGDLAEAHSTHEEAKVLYAQSADLQGMAWSDTNIGRIAAQQLQYAHALPQLHAALDGYARLGDGFGIAEILEAVAFVTVRTGGWHTTSALIGAATRLRQRLDAPLKQPDLDEFNGTLQLAASWDGHVAAFAGGYEMDVDQAVRLAMEVSIKEQNPSPAIEEPAQQKAHRQFGITRREHEVLMLLVRGLTDNEIGRELGVSPRTVQSHNTSLARKLDAESRVAVIRIAHRAGIMSAIELP